MNGGWNFSIILFMCGNAATNACAISAPVWSADVKTNECVFAWRSAICSSVLCLSARSLVRMIQPLPNFGHPIRVRSVVVEVILFQFDPLALRAKCLGDNLSPEALVEEEDKLTRPR